jgi:hypothetical protein
MLLAARRLIRYALSTRTGGTEIPHPIEPIEALGHTTRCEPGGGVRRAKFSGRRLA